MKTTSQIFWIERISFFHGAKFGKLKIFGNESRDMKYMLEIKQRKAMKTSLILLLTLVCAQLAFAYTDGCFFIQTPFDDRVWTVENDIYGENAHIVLEPYDGTARQLFQLIRNANGTFEILTHRGEYVSSIYLDGRNQSWLVVKKNQHSASQSWKLSPTMGFWNITSNSGRNVDIPGNSKQNGQKLWIHNKNGTSAQFWIFKEAPCSPELEKRSKTPCLRKRMPVKQMSSKCITQKDRLSNSNHFDSEVKATGSVTLQIENGIHIFAFGYVELQGVKSGLTHVRKTFRHRLYTSPSGKRISGFSLSPNTEYMSFMTGEFSRTLSEAKAEFGFCQDGKIHNIDIPEVDAVISLIGDTGASDISSDDDCNCDSRIEGLSFSVLYVEECGFNHLDSYGKDGCITIYNKHSRTFPGYKNEVLQFFPEKLIHLNPCEVREEIKIKYNQNNEDFHLYFKQAERYISDNATTVTLEEMVNQKSKWSLEYIGNGYHRIKNALSNSYLHMEHGTLGLTLDPGGWYSSFWVIDDCNCISVQ